MTKFDETLKFLGSHYTVKNFDLEDVIYRQLDNYEFEISGLRISGNYNATIYVWKDKKHLKSIENIRSKEQLLTHLETLVSELPHSQD